MLRIAKYNKITGKKIDLKELENFGFEKLTDCYKCSVCTRPNYRGNSELDIYVHPITRAIYTRSQLLVDEDKIHDKIYDLIVAGYVEKVEEE